MIHVGRGGDGSYILRLHGVLGGILQALPGQIRDLLDRPDFRDRVVQRLFPRTYDDDDREIEYRKLLGDDLRQRKVEALESFEALIAGAAHDATGLTVTIPENQFDLVISFLNDVRLTIATELDIREEGWAVDIDDDDPRAPRFHLLQLLAVLEESLLGATGLVDFEVLPEELDRPPDGLH